MSNEDKKIYPYQVNPHLRKDIADHLPMFSAEYINEPAKNRADRMIAAYELPGYVNKPRLETGIPGLYLHYNVTGDDQYE